MHLAFISLGQQAQSADRAGCIWPNPVNCDGKYDLDQAAVIDNKTIFLV